jgi:hypothetical protein
MLALSPSLAHAAGDDVQPVDFTHNTVDAPAPVPGAVFGTAPAVKTGTAICATATQLAANANTDCETTSAGPHNETSIAVNPANPQNMIGGANDYQLGLNPGGHVSESVLSRAHVTSDGGKTWSMFPLFSNSAYQATGDPAVAFDAAGHAYCGTLGFRFVGPVNAQNPDVLVSNSGDGGRYPRRPARPVAGPVKVATVIDGATDYPIALGRQTYQDSVFRTWAAGNIAADPTNPARLAVVWSDMRDSVTPVPSDPYTAKTNPDVIVSQSFDRGATWSAPTPLKRAGDQFMPWGAYDRSGLLRIGTFDRSVDPANHKYGYSLATETGSGTLAFTTAVISTATSDPTAGDRWFARTVNAAFPSATAFLGDYSNIAATADGGVVAYWTDMRNNATFAGGTGHGEDAYFATAS